MTDALFEPLEELAEFTFRMAPEMCDPAMGCAPYHRFWSTVRHLDLDGRLPRGLPFFAAQLGELGADRSKVRVLLAGSADTGLPMLMAHAARDAGVSVSIEVVDRCRTPLAQIDRLAEASGLHIATHHGQIAGFEGRGFDAVVTHNMLGFNTEADRPGVLAAMAATLRAGGRQLSVEFLSDHRPPRNPAETAGLWADMAERLRKMGWPAEKIAGLKGPAIDYWQTNLPKGPYPEPQFRVDLAAAGMRVVALDYVEDVDRSSPRTQPETNRGRKHAFIAAERPG